jgi:hypothetical protein
MVNDVSEFIKELKNDNDKGFLHVYRGHADTRWNLMPSIYRNKRGKLLKNEHIMFYDCISAKPDEFGGCHYTVDYLIKMQHYGLPTRLLDVTSNPLVALFFAVEGCKKEKGEVVCLKIPLDKVKPYNSDTVSILANTAKLKYTCSNYTIPEIKGDKCKKKCKCSNNQNYCEMRCNQFYEENESINYLQYEINSEKPHFSKKINPLDINSIVCVRAKMENHRIINQAGLLLLYGIGMTKKSVPCIPDAWISSKIQIPHNQKKPILEELKKINIAASFIYPELPSITKEIKERYE